MTPPRSPTFATNAGSALSARTWMWFSVLTFASIGFSSYFACATPFAALAALAATTMSRRSGLVLMVVVWLANQIVGCVLLHYPSTWDSLMWGAAIGIAAIISFLAARVSVRAAKHEGVRQIVGFAAAFVGYEAVLYAAQLPLGSSADAFTLDVVLYVLFANIAALIGLLALHKLGAWIGLTTELKLPEPRLALKRSSV
jgi:hypothetical protein